MSTDENGNEGKIEVKKKEKTGWVPTASWAGIWMKVSEWCPCNCFVSALTKHICTMLTFNLDKSFADEKKKQEKKYNYFIFLILMNAANPRFYFFFKKTFVGSSSLPSYLGRQLDHRKLNTDLLKLIKIKASEWVLQSPHYFLYIL